MTTSRGSWPTEGFSDRRDSVLVEENVERAAKLSGPRAPRGNMQAGVRAEEYLGKCEPEKQVMMEVGVPGKPYENRICLLKRCLVKFQRFGQRKDGQG